MRSLQRDTTILKRHPDTERSEGEGSHRKQILRPAKKKVGLRMTTKSAAETTRVGEKIGKLLKAGDVVALSGELGAGKTTLVRGIVRALGVDPDEVASPTFVLVHEYEGKFKIYHMDWYRLKAVKGEDALLAEECFASPSVALVEWPERGRGVLPKKRIEVKISHSGGDKRVIEYTGF